MPILRKSIVMIDFQGHPIRYDELGVYDEIIAQERCVELDLQVQTKGSRGVWQQVGSAKLDEDSLEWRSGFRAGLQQLQDLHVKASDPHYDAKLFVCAHPYGTGSLHCEFGSADVNRACAWEMFPVKPWVLGCICGLCACSVWSFSAERVAVRIKSWCGHEHCRSRNGSGGLICGAFSNWIWQLKMHCSSLRPVAGSSEGQIRTLQTPFRNGLARLSPLTFQTVQPGGGGKLENSRQSATTRSAD